MNFDMYWLPAFWACYLINSDASGMSDGEQKECDAWAIDYAAGLCIGVSDSPEFRAHHDADRYVPFACDCLEFTFEAAP